MSRDLESVGLEADYWQAIIAELQAAHDAIGGISDVFATVSTNTIALLPFATRTAGIMRPVEALAGASSEGMRLLLEVQSLLAAIGDLSAGRAIAIHHELGLEPPEATA